MATSPIGPEFQVNSFTPGNQRTWEASPQSIAMDADGDFVVSWTSNGQDGSGTGVYAQRYNAAGVPLGGEFQVNSTTASFQQFSTVAMDADGDFAVSWESYGQDGSGTGVYAQRYALDPDASQSESTIVNDDTAPTLSINDVSVTEGDSGTPNAVFTVALSAASGLPVSVNYATSDDTATAGSDYTTNAGTHTFAPGETSKTIEVAVMGDTLDEANESFFVNLDTPTNATITDAQGVGTITDDDAAPSLSINDVTVDEAVGTVSFTVALSAASGQAITVDYATVDDTATAGSDYTAQSDTLSFDPGETSQTITVQVLEDTVDEANETFKINLSNPTNSTITDNQGIGTITDDDAAPTVSISPDEIANVEGDNGDLTAYTYTVSLSNASASPITVNYSTNNGTATVADGDYVNNDGALVFAPGVTEQQITVTVNGDTKAEDIEDFTVKLDSATNATVDSTADQSRGLIINGDNQPTISISDALPVTEGDSGSSEATFTISLSEASGQSIAVAYDTADGTATTTDDDYAAIALRIYVRTLLECSIHTIAKAIEFIPPLLHPIL